jgi:hypothetical protein
MPPATSAYYVPVAGVADWLWGIGDIVTMLEEWEKTR